MPFFMSCFPATATVFPVTAHDVDVDTVDGRNPAPVDMVNIPLFTGIFTSQVVSQISSFNSMYIFCAFWFHCPRIVNMLDHGP